MSFVAILAAGYAGWAALLFLMQRSIVFPGTHLGPSVATNDAIPPGVEPVRIPFSAGTVEAWLILPRQVHRSPAVILAHGNAELIRDGLTEARQLADLGLAVLLVEYPGYGASDGRPSRRTIAEVFQTAWDWLAARPEVDRDRIVGMGRSLGGGAITDLAVQRPLCAMVLQSTFTSVRDLAKRYLVPGILVRDPFDNLSVVRRFEGPVLLIHGTRDQVIAYVNSERLARAASDATLLTLACGHNDCLPDAYLPGLRDFLIAAGILEPAPEPPG